MLLAIVALLYFMRSAWSNASDDIECDGSSLLQIRSIFNESGFNLITSRHGSHGRSNENAVMLGWQEPTGLSPIITRPNHQVGIAEKVHFGIFLNTFYSVNLADETWDADVVVYFRWSDPRTQRLLPVGAQNLTLSEQNAPSLLWLPDIAVTDAEEGENHVISSSILIKPNGSVEQVNRLYLRLKQSFNTRDFPFDTQALIVAMASRTYMRSDLQLVPMEDFLSQTDTAKQFVNSDWKLTNASLVAFFDAVGPWEKSRGMLKLTVKRDIAEFRSSIFIPSIIFLLMTWSALWLPLATPYVMPRVAVNAFALLCQLQISQVAQSMLPSNGDASWMTIYLETCVELQFLVVTMNMILLAIEHNQGEGLTLASTLNKEFMYLFPITTTLNIVVLGLVGHSTSQVFIVLTYLGNIVYLYVRFHYRRGIKSEPA